jgi:beta-lactamase class D
MRKLVFIICFLLLSSHAAAEDQAIAKCFTQRGVDGTIVISSLNSGKTFIHNAPRANRRFPAASTFKIFNTLISLEEKAISGKNDVLKWDGHVYDLPDWNRDQTLESAFKVSCVWYFQALARRVGKDNYLNYIHKTNYGKLHEPFEETTFWLDGSLTISATEQVEFLKKVYQRSLSFSPSSYETLSEIMLVEKTPNFMMRAKTGWATRLKPQTGWYVGYVEAANDVWFFAMNMEIRNEKDLPMRRDLTREALRGKGIIE